MNRPPWSSPVRGRLLPILVAVATLLAVVGAAIAVLTGEAAAREHLDRAETLLFETPFAEAPTVDALPAAVALGALGEAREAGLPSGERPRYRGLRAFALTLDHLRRGELVFAADQLEQAERLLGDDRSLLQVVRLELALATAAAGEAGSSLAAPTLVGTPAPSPVLEAARAAFPDDPRLLLAGADADLDAGRLDAAGRALDRLEELVSADPAARALLDNRRGLLAEARGHEAVARSAYRRALDADGTQVDAHINLGRLALDEGELASAGDHFEAALRSEPTAGGALFGRGLVALAEGRVDAAERDFLEAAVSAPEDAAIRLALGDVARRRGDASAALVAYREGLALDPADALGWLRLGNTLVEVGEAAEAVRAFERAVRLDPELAAAHNGLGVSRLAEGDVAQAREAFARARDLDPQDPAPRRNLARLGETG
ncbi:MAG TPA: tetratricopeptide repeat protein [Polyangiaceae bacterium LLY-WYZ-14_1]|nr:tetratricopeptide repeat protein [Polyangiaceae bacterium LLY-WYZ-14_1]